MIGETIGYTSWLIAIGLVLVLGGLLLLWAVQAEEPGGPALVAATAAMGPAFIAADMGGGPDRQLELGPVYVGRHRSEP